MIIASKAGQGRALKAVALDLFMHRFPVPESTLRESLLWVIETAERRNKRILDSGPAAEERQVERAKAGVSIYHPLLLSYHLESSRSGDHRRLSRKRAERRRGLMAATGTVIDLALHDDVPAADSIVDLFQSLGMDETVRRVERGLIDAELSGEFQVPESAAEMTRHQVMTVPFDRLCAARNVITGWTPTFTNLVLAAVSGCDEASEILITLLRQDGAKWLISTVMLPTDRWRTAAGLLGLSASDLFLEVGWGYVKGLFPVAIRLMAQATRANTDCDETTIRAFEGAGEIDTSDWDDMLYSTAEFPVAHLLQMAETL
jgi:hypothetical protein